MTSTNRRAAVFSEIQTLVSEYDDAVALQDSDDFWSVDDCISQLIVRLNAETRRVRKIKQTAGTAAVCSAA